MILYRSIHGRFECLSLSLRAETKLLTVSVFPQGVTAAIFLSSCSRAPKPYTDVGAVENLRTPLMDNSRPGNDSLHQNGRGQSVPIDRPSAMNSLIACNSYSNRAGAWSRASYSGRYSHSYGSIENKRYLELTTWYTGWSVLRTGNKWRRSAAQNTLSLVNSWSSRTDLAVSNSMRLDWEYNRLLVLTTCT